ncbi:hypothetical protein [Bradyrhizobium brasilense]|uniref:hypothetical protein n=1 Tax=Bradyrhizobium brasilense TaxID=1419277 RepID=UPI0011786996|nr:hypothetical protein [Bradyrhizobium brasilense]
MPTDLFTANVDGAIKQRRNSVAISLTVTLRELAHHIPSELCPCCHLDLPAFCTCGSLGA